jgi:hypothetical protein
MAKRHKGDGRQHKTREQVEFSNGGVSIGGLQTKVAKEDLLLNVNIQAYSARQWCWPRARVVGSNPTRSSSFDKLINGEVA